MPSTKKTTSSPKAPKKGAKAEKPFITSDMEEAYQHFLPAAEAQPHEEVSARGRDVAVARSNIERGVEAIRPHVDQIQEDLPKVSVKDLLELPSLALALIHADGRVPHVASSGEIEAAFARVAPLRDLTLKYLEVASAVGLVPEGRVRAIRAGKGRLDNARDCVDIVGVFREFEGTLAGKHPFTAAQIDELATTGTWLVKTITPRGTQKAPTAREPEVVTRDRFWKLVEARHDSLRTVGVALFGIKHVDDYVPPLMSRTAAPAKATPAAEPAPPAPPPMP